MTPRRNAPQTPQGLARSLSAALRAQARILGAPAADLRKQVAFGALYRRMFSDSQGNWMVLGGNALFLRTSGGRFTQDIDLARSDAWDSAASLELELQQIFGRTGLTP